jgi:hypothetical protein
MPATEMLLSLPELELSRVDNRRFSTQVGKFGPFGHKNTRRH